MEIGAHLFEAVDWESLPSVETKGLTGSALTREAALGRIRVRLVDYTPGYAADHWCSKGHVLFCLAGELRTLTADGDEVTLQAGMGYLVGDDSTPHRSSAPTGARLFIVD